MDFTARYLRQEAIIQEFNSHMLANDLELARATLHAMTTWLDDIREGDLFTESKIDSCFEALIAAGGNV